jgi:hypothetical protein
MLFLNCWELLFTLGKRRPVEAGIESQSVRIYVTTHAPSRNTSETPCFPPPLNTCNSGPFAGDVTGACCHARQGRISDPMGNLRHSDSFLLCFEAWK